MAPTILEAAKLPHPAIVNGVMQEPLHGVSMLNSFDDPAAAERHETQYFEMVCNRGICHKGWMAVTRHGNLPWVVVGVQPLSDDVWELYDTNKDWSQARNLAAQMPEKVAELKRLFDLEAAKYNVFPLDDRKAERSNPDIAGRPQVVHGSTQLLFSGIRRVSENTAINVKNKSHSVTAEVEIPASGVEGVIAAPGGHMGGSSLYVHEGKLKYLYNFLGLQCSAVTAATALPAGKHQVRMEFTYDGGGLGKGASVALYIDGNKAAEGRIARTHAFLFSIDETMDVGCDVGEPVSEDYGPRGNAFTGKLGSNRRRCGGEGGRPPDRRGGAIPTDDDAATAAGSDDCYVRQGGAHEEDDSGGYCFNLPGEVGDLAKRVGSGGIRDRERCVCLRLSGDADGCLHAVGHQLRGGAFGAGD